MPHANEQLRDHIATTVTSLTTTGARVYNTRVYPSGSDKIPGLNVFISSYEKVEENETLGGRQKWDLGITVHARAKPVSTTDAHEQIDDIVAEVTAAVMADPTLGNRVLWCELMRVEFGKSGNLELPAGSAEMEFNLRYCIAASVPTTLIYTGG